MTDVQTVRAALVFAGQAGFEDSNEWLMVVDNYKYYAERGEFWAGGDERWHINELLFSHDFAKALWGEELDSCIACGRSHSYLGDCDAGCGNCTPTWEFELQQMVIAEDPIKYLGEHLPK